MFATAGVDTTLFDALVDARQQHGGRHVIADDLDMRPMTYNLQRTIAATRGIAEPSIPGPDRPTLFSPA
jgi:acyl-[acyl-carrier-protein]-phospholipid O-acyltransferase/long-chain-fatty-acid--[acyl-carrier-protein] ligase